MRELAPDVVEPGRILSDLLSGTRCAQRRSVGRSASLGWSDDDASTAVARDASTSHRRPRFRSATKTLGCISQLADEVPPGFARHIDGVGIACSTRVGARDGSPTMATTRRAFANATVERSSVLKSFYHLSKVLPVSSAAQDR